MTVRSTHHRIARAAAVVVAGTVLGVAGSLAFVAAEATSPTAACRASRSDLMRAAESARRLQALRPELFEQSPRPADRNDLRLAAEWARRMEILDPDGRCRPPAEWDHPGALSASCVGPAQRQ
jgi:hypothetical protein